MGHCGRFYFVVSRDQWNIYSEGLNVVELYDLTLDCVIIRYNDIIIDEESRKHPVPS